MGWTFVAETEAEQELLARGACEDYPCCGHTPDDPCLPQYYDAPGYYDTSIRGNEHNLCDHEFGECNVDDYYDEDECEGDENCNCDSFGINHDAGWRARGCWTIFEGPLTEDGGIYG
jgi:hypothetical protein